jgi:hypothetical protein
MLNVFRQKQNLSTLWEVLVEEKKIKIENEKELFTVQQVFETNIEIFCKENSELFENQNLININKKFIKFIQPYFQEKKSFDTLLLKKQQEFENFHKINIPIVPELNKKIVDEPIQQLNELMEEMIKKRNLEFIPSNTPSLSTVKPSNHIKLVIDEHPLENYSNKVIDLDKRVMWSEDILPVDVTEIAHLNTNKLTKEKLNGMLEVNMKDKLQNIKIKIKELLKEIEELQSFI